MPGLALADALLCLVDGQGLRPHAAWVTDVRLGAAPGSEGGEAELRLRVVVRNLFPAMAALSARAGGACLVQTPARALGAAAGGLSPKARRGHTQ